MKTILYLVILLSTISIYSCSDNSSKPVDNSSNDGFIHFKRTNGPYLADIHELKFDSFNNIYTANYFNRLDTLQIMKSSDKGKSWKDITINAPIHCAKYDIKFFNGSDYIFIANRAGDSICFSIDGGSSWELIKTGIKVDQIGILSISPKGYLFITGYTNKGVNNLYRSEDGGRNWKQVTNILSNKPIVVISFGKNDEVLFCINLQSNSYEYYFSNDNGDNCQSILKSVNNTALPGNFLLVNNFFFIAEQKCIRRSADNGMTWNNLTTGLYYKYVYGITSNSKGELFICHNYGISKSTDDGDNWFDIYLESKGCELSFITVDNNDKIYYIDTNNMIYYENEP